VSGTLIATNPPGFLGVSTNTVEWTAALLWLPFVLAKLSIKMHPPKYVQNGNTIGAIDATH
jgi:hypothetical protein